MKVLVIYPKGSLNEGNQQPPIRPQDKQMEVEVDENDLRQLGTPSKDEELCEIVWRMMNRLDRSRVERYLDQYRVRSMMVGDIVEISGRRFRVADCGFEPIRGAA